MSQATAAPDEQHAPAPAQPAGPHPTEQSRQNQQPAQEPPAGGGASEWTARRPRWVLWLAVVLAALVLAGGGFVAGYASSAAIAVVNDIRNGQVGPFGDRDGRSPGPGWNDGNGTDTAPNS